MKKKCDVIYVKWLDPYFESGWKPADNYKTDDGGDGIISHSVGYLVHESKKCIKLCLNWSDSGMASDVQTIPKKFMELKKKVGTICV